ncbi:MAG: Trk system potassium transporter TrkA [Bacilli bacterium]|nr:Trk system potassium transporter TrkA [Bacilli bacterium]
MKIIIVGSGKMGSYLSNILANENHDITVIDKNETVINKLNNTQDISILCGNGLVAATLEEADIKNTDILISTMKNDEDNIVCCLLAKNLGVKNTIMRIRNPEYKDSMHYIKNDLGLSMTINPELLTAKEIANTLNFPSGIKINYFFKGKIEMLEFKIKENSNIIRLSVKDLISKIKKKIIIVAVERNDKVFVPNGEFVFELGDKLIITSKLQNINNFFKFMGNVTFKTKDVMIIGGSKMSYYLAYFLENMGINSKIIEMDKNKCEILSEKLSKTLIINGDGSDKNLLLEEGIEEMDAFVSATGIDEENIIYSLFANSLNIPKVITKINHLTFNDIVESVGIENVQTPHIIASNQVLKYIRAMENSRGGNMESLVRIMDDKLEMMEFVINDEFKYINKCLKDIHFKEGIIVVCINRKGNVIFPTGEDVLKVNDNIIISTTKSNIKGLNDILR